MSCAQLQDVVEEGHRIARLAATQTEPREQEAAMSAISVFTSAMWRSVVNGCKPGIPASNATDFLALADFGNDWNRYLVNRINDALVAYRAFQNNSPLSVSTGGSNRNIISGQGGGQCRPSSANSQALNVASSTTCSSAEINLREWSNRGGAACTIFWGLVAQYSCQERYISTMGSSEYWNVTCQLPTSAEAMATTDFPFTSSCR